MSTPTDPTPPAPETAPDGHTWLAQAYCEQEGIWGPPDPMAMPPEWPSWQLDPWYAGRTGMVQIPGPPGLPGSYQVVFGGWLPWQSRADSYDQAAEFPTAVRSTVGAMQAALAPPPAPETAPTPNATAPTTTDQPSADPAPAPPLTDPTPTA
jgi:hypothetical protein